MPETLVNRAPVALAATITSSGTTLTRSSAATGWPGDSNGPPSGNFRMVMTDGTNYEIVLVTGGQGTTSLTATRAYELIGGVQTGFAFAATVTMMTPIASAGYLDNIVTGLASPAIVDQGRLSLLEYPALDGTYGDDFDATSLAGKWSYYTGSGASLSTLAGWVAFPTAAAIIQAVPSAPWTIETEVIPAGSDVGEYEDEGLIITTGSAMGSATDLRLGVGMNNSFTNYRIVLEKFVNGAFVTQLTVATAQWLAAPIYLAFHYDGTNLYARWGYNRQQMYSIIAGFNPVTGYSITPAYFGLNAATPGSLFNYFRYKNS